MMGVIIHCCHDNAAVYDVIKDNSSDKYQLKFAHYLARHREDIQCLTRVTGNYLHVSGIYGDYGLIYRFNICFCFIGWSNHLVVHKQLQCC